MSCYNATIEKEVKRLQTYRLFGIVHLLLDKKILTAQELADHFEVSKRTILRDVDVLSMAGIPIYTQQGKGGGISILENYVLDKTTLSKQEQDHILLALQSLEVTRNIEVENTVEKLAQLFGQTQTRWIEVDFSGWGNEKSDKEKFEKIKQAILAKQVISIEYVNANGESSIRKINPLKLVFKSKEWYLQAYCTDKMDYRIFKLNRIRSTNLVDKYFVEQSFTLPKVDYSDNSKSCSVEMELWFSKQMAYRIYDEFSYDSIKKNEDGSFLVKVEYPEDAWLYSFLLSFGVNVRVLSPTSVKKRVENQVAEMYRAMLEEKC